MGDFSIPDVLYNVDKTSSFTHVYQRHQRLGRQECILLDALYSSDNQDSGLEIATDTVANATNIFSLATKNSSLVAKVATRFLYDLDLN